MATSCRPPASSCCTCLVSGVTASRTHRGVSGGSALAPSAIQSRRIAYASSLGRSCLPPPCGTFMSGFRRRRLASGSRGFTRRPKSSRMSVVSSNGSSNPRSESRKPALPLGEPWQAPELHVCFDSATSTSFSNCLGRGTAWCVTVIGTVTRFPLSAMTASVVPSPDGMMTVPRTVATDSFATTMLTCRVRSRDNPAASTLVTATCCRSLAPSRTIVCGNTSKGGVPATAAAAVRVGGVASWLVWLGWLAWPGWLVSLGWFVFWASVAGGGAGSLHVTGRSTCSIRPRFFCSATARSRSDVGSLPSAAVPVNVIWHDSLSEVLVSEKPLGRRLPRIVTAPVNAGSRRLSRSLISCLAAPRVRLTGAGGSMANNASPAFTPAMLSTPSAHSGGKGTCGSLRRRTAVLTTEVELDGSPGHSARSRTRAEDSSVQPASAARYSRVSVVLAGITGFTTPRPDASPASEITTSPS